MRITFKGNGVVFDQARKKNLCKFEGAKFVDGVWQTGEYTTDDPRTIELLKDYPTVPKDAYAYYLKEKEAAEAEAEKLRLEKEEADRIAAEAGDNYENFTVPELKALAKSNDIELGDATKKADILELIRA